jgi:FlaA1/EpsC-like NDP-sugar epimerase
VEKVVCISTDKAVNPSSVMGCCKRIAEMLVQSGHFTGTTACAVRFGNVLGSRGSVIPVFQRQIARGGPITVTDPEIRRYFMTISEASQLVIQAGSLGEGSDLFLLDMGDPVRIVDLARDMIRLAGLEPEEDIQIRFTGLRPGEKLLEELWLPTERLVPTSHQKISRVISPPFDFEDLDRQIRVLTRLAVEMDDRGIVEHLQGLVPEYTPQYEHHPEGPEAEPLPLSAVLIQEKGNAANPA